MLNKAYIFPGQASQFRGMGKDLYESSDFAKLLFEQANDFLGFRISDIMFEGSDEELRQTHIIKFGGLQQRRQRPGNSIQGGGAGVPGPVLFGALDLLPVRPDLIHVLDTEIAEHVRMATDQFVGDPAGDPLEVKRAALLGQLAVEHHLQKHIAQFLLQFVIVAGLDRVNQFIDLLDRVPAQSHVILLPVPGAAPGRPEPLYDGQ